jgi:outer membrane receptor protein involved in Fe transport
LISGLTGDFNPANYQAKYISIDKNEEGVYYTYTPTDSLLTSYQVDLINTGAYTQLDINPSKKLKITGTLRYDRLGYKFKNHLTPSAFTGAPSETNHFEHFTPKVGATYNFERDRGIYVNYSVGFSPPNINELYRGVKVPVLHPSTYYNYEAGGWVSFNNDRGYLELNVYSLEGFNEIVSVRSADGSYSNQNAGKTAHQGFEASLKYYLMEGLMLRGGNTLAKHTYISYVEKGIDFSGNSMSQAPCQISNIEITYKPGILKGFRIGIEMQSVGNYFMDAKNTQKYNGYTIFNARCGYTHNALEFWINAINFTDQVYATTVEKNMFGTSYRPGQLKTFSFGIAYHFTSK